MHRWVCEDAREQGLVHGLVNSSTWEAPDAFPQEVPGSCPALPCPPPLVPGPALGYPAAGWTKPSRWGCGDLGERVRQERGLRNGSVPSPSEPLQPPSCGSRRVLRHESGQEKKRMNNGIGFLHGLRVPGTRSHTEQGDPLCPHRQRLQRERLRGCDGQ